MTERQLAERKRLRDLRVAKRAREKQRWADSVAMEKRKEERRLPCEARELAAQGTPEQLAGIRRANARKGRESRRGYQGPEPEPVSCVWAKW